MSDAERQTLKPTLTPLGDAALLIRFSSSLSPSANDAAIAAGRDFAQHPPPGVVEVSPNLVSVLLAYDPRRTDFHRLSSEVQMRLAGALSDVVPTARLRLPVSFDGEDLAEVAGLLHLDVATFVSRHNASPMHVLATGFAPGFVYCGFHPPELTAPRRPTVRPMVPAGTVLFAAGQTAVAATPIRTGWHIIGHTSFRNFDPAATPPTKLTAGDEIVFEATR